MRRLICLACLLCPALTGAADQKPAPEESKVPEYCRQLIDAYNEADERARFFAAAGVDNELTAEEYDANAKEGVEKPFVRPYDSWKRFKAADKDGKGRIDWFEASNARDALRKQVLERFDADEDGKLTGKERTAANAALHAGKVRLPSSRRMRRGWARAIEKYDADGDGKLSDAERTAATEDFRKRRAEARRRWILRRYDTDGDGELSEEENAKLEADRAARAKRRAERRTAIIEKYDTDGDGTLSDAEKQAAREQWRQRIAEMRRKQIAAWDTDEDGKLSEAEKEARRKALAAERRRRREAADTNDDGELSREERRAWFKKYRARFDADGDGELSDQERQKMGADWMKHHMRIRTGG